MTTMVEAIYENGVLRPSQPLPLSEGSHVTVIVVAEEDASGANLTPAQILAEIAAMPLEGSGDPFSGRDHDEVLYGWKKQP